jgi:hypothetical protein
MSILSTSSTRISCRAPLGNFPRKSGRLKVVDPSPVPKNVLTAVKRSAYVVLDTAEPSHNKYPDGIAL